MVLGMNGVIAFGLNVVSFTANKKVGALSMTVAGEPRRPSGLQLRLITILMFFFAANIKQVLTIVLAVSIFDLRVSGANIFGISVTLLGGGMYTIVELREKRVALVTKIEKATA